ncbi:HAMP domain-containing sensor histidine kinase [Luteipulveratus mongoliensis]|uniref:histidine kinase n=1 Tax=Luteipulveratus mongoliensis TaxID=571913 RepID=A0A0K1JF45_9MICO|nr:ATP-binding protein [Luteipulveratus mongoliensis]AKU15205.1 hypothetical protein VV02_03890 [Luteipulveratus mongoliensis]
MNESESNSRRRAPSPASWLNLAEWSLRRKVAIVLLIPVLLAAIFGGLRVRSELADSSRYSEAKSQVSVLDPALRYLASSENLAVLSTTSGSEPRVVQRQRTIFDRAKDDLGKAAGNASLTSAQSREIQAALGLSSGITGITVDTPPSDTLQRVDDVGSHITAVINSISATQPRPDTRLSALTDLLSGRRSLATQRIMIATRSNNPSLAETVTLSGVMGEETSSIDNLAARIGENDPQVITLRRQNSARLAAAADDSPATTLPGVDASVGAYQEVSNILINGVASTSSKRESSARDSALRDAAIIIIALIAALALGLLVARMLIKPIRQVRRGALDIANKRLPAAVEQIRSGKEPPALEPLPVNTHEEMGQLARAVDDMHRQALHLASEQARLRTQVGNMFETMSRRSTSLVNQQLGLIESLENDEEDPRRLESLFKLDHLAARMRRNGESLLVLADAPNRSTSGSDISLADVLRAALSEVQDYQRVQLGSTPDQLIKGSAASDMVHLFAELIDNALAYSPPHTNVRVTGARAADGGTLIEVDDSGLGMAQDTIDQYNASLKSGGEVTPDTARHMGLFVVSRLSTTHEVVVRLYGNEDGGTTASIFIPEELLTQRERREPTGPITQRPRSVDTDPVTHDRDAASVGSGPTLVSLSSGASGASSSLASARSESRSQAATLSSGLPKRRPGATGAGQMGSISTLRPISERDAEPERATSYDFGRTSDLDRTSDFGSSSDLGSTSSYGSSDTSSTSYDVLGSSDASASGLPTRPTGADVESDGFPSVFEWDQFKPSEPLLPRTDDDTEIRVSPSNTSAFFSARSQVIEAPAAVPAPAPAEAWTDAPAEPMEIEDFPTDEAPAKLEDSPIFASMQSQWLSDDDSASTLPWASTEVDTGWQAADRASDIAPAAETTVSGLPRRRPGEYLVPGSVELDGKADLSRDPQAIRDKLNRHLAGVSRGRSRASHTVSDPRSESFEQTGRA